MAYKKKEKKSLLLYYDYMEQFELLDDSQFRKLIYAMIDYDKTGNEPKLDKLTKIAFISIKQRLARDKQMWEEMCKKNSENIKKRWEKKDTTVYDGIRANTTVYQSIPKYTKNTDIDSDIDIDIDNDIDNEIDIDSVCVYNTPTTHTEILNYCIPNFKNYDSKSLEKSCKKFFNYYKEKEWQGVKNWKERIEMWIEDDIDAGKIKKNEEETVDEAGYKHKNGRRVL